MAHSTACDQDDEDATNILARQQQWMAWWA